MSSQTYPIGPPWPQPQPWQPPHPWLPQLRTHVTWKEQEVSDYEMKQLAEIVDALEKARIAFGGLADDEDKGRGNRAAAYLSARFGVKETTVIDMLLEDS